MENGARSDILMTADEITVMKNLIQKRRLINLLNLTSHNVELKRGTLKPRKCEILIPSPFSDLLSEVTK